MSTIPEIRVGMKVHWKSAHDPSPFLVEQIIEGEGYRSFRLLRDGKHYSTADVGNLVPVTKLGKVSAPTAWWMGEELVLEVPWRDFTMRLDGSKAIFSSLSETEVTK